MRAAVEIDDNGSALKSSQRPKDLEIGVVKPISIAVPKKEETDMTWLSKATSWSKKTIGKATSFVSKATQNPIGAAADLLKSGGASKSGTPKTPTATRSASAPTGAESGTKTMFQKAMTWFMKNWYWVLLPVLVAFFIWYLMSKKKGSAARRRRTAPARAARARARRVVRRKR